MSLFDIRPSDLQEAPYQAGPLKYCPSQELRMAVKVAIKLKQPLLLTGEPGTGKTQLAYALAQDLSQDYPEYLPHPLIFHTKTSSIASDLFYTYDALGHFHDANVKKGQGLESALKIHQYIYLQALGKAIALANPEEVLKGTYIQASDGSPKSSVVLIDEIDKAPRDFPNDILNEIENFEFEIKEANRYKISKSPEQHIMLILTSNSEKNLPDAFLRRCVFFHIPFPSEAELLEIVKVHLGEQSTYADETLIEHFMEIREIIRKKKPATAELLSWLRILELEGFLEDHIRFDELKNVKKHILRYSYSILAKTSEDLEIIKSRLS